MKPKQLLEKHLIVKKSTLPLSGKGLFTKQLIKRGTKIVEYKGKITNWNNAYHDNGKNVYIYYVNRNHVIDAKHDKKILARYANDAKGIEQLNKVTNNSTYIIEANRVFIKAIKDIPPGDEILVGYGKEYWNVIKKYNCEASK